MVTIMSQKPADRLSGLEVFVSVAEARGFSAAALKLGVSKAHVSRQILALERRLDAQLFIRTTRRVSLTEVGQAFYLRCRDILGNLEEAEQAVQELQQQPQGRLRLSVAGAFAEEYIAPASVDYMQQFPKMVVELDFNNRIVDMIAEGYDLAIRAGALEDSSLIATRLADRNLHIVASRDYLDRHGVPRSPSDLNQHNCLTGTLNSWRFLQSDRHIDLRVEGNWKSNSGRAVLQAALRGLGLAELPYFYVREDLAAGRLTTVLADFRPTDSAMWAVYPHNRYLSAKVRLFLEFLHNRLRQDAVA
jgi:DNA-binding transcriptional LysR family regulator